jgi:hypothetical protein
MAWRASRRAHHELAKPKQLVVTRCRFLSFVIVFVVRRSSLVGRRTPFTARRSVL